MSRLITPTEEEELIYRDWIESRPENVRSIAERFDPWSLYRMKSTGHRVTIYSFDEQEDDTITLTVLVSGDFNLINFERRVFGIEPDDLEPCELPMPDEIVGILMSNNEASEFINRNKNSP